MPSSYSIRAGSDNSTDNSSNSTNIVHRDASSIGFASGRDLANDSGNSTTDRRVQISMEEYKKLCNSSVELYKAKKTIEKLTASNQKKDALIEKLSERHKFKHLSPVSKLNLKRS